MRKTGIEEAHNLGNVLKSLGEKNKRKESKQKPIIETYVENYHHRPVNRPPEVSGAYKRENKPKRKKKKYIFFVILLSLIVLMVGNWKTFLDFLKGIILIIILVKNQ